MSFTPNYNVLTGGFGPSPNPYTLPKELNTYIRECTSYMIQLPLFSQYIVWRYSIGSAAVNTRLIFNEPSPNATYWTYLFFKYFDNTFGSKHVKIDKLFLKYKVYLYKPSAYKSLPKPEQSKIANQLIDDYITLLQKIIIRSPEVKEGFDVYKTAAIYPALPKSGNELPAEVVQQPFNSTSINPHFNYYLFASDNSCFFKIHVNPGAKCLYVPPTLAAYSFEAEIILPVGTIFNIYSLSMEPLDYVEPSDMNIQAIQNKEDIVVGTVYVINDAQPTKSGNATVIKTKEFPTYGVNI